MSFIKYLFLTLIFIIQSISFAQKGKEDDSWDKDDSMDDYKLIETDSIPELAIDFKDVSSVQIANPNKRIKKEKKLGKSEHLRGKHYYDIKTQRGFTKRDNTFFFFRFPKVARLPENTYAQEIYFYDVREKKVRELSYKKYIRDVEEKKKNYLLLHGPYQEVKDREVIKQAYFYLGTKHERWEEYDKDFTLIQKQYYNFGWNASSIIRYHDEFWTKVKEVIPYFQGEKHGNYFSFFEDGILSMEGEYEHDVQIGTWVEYYPNGNRKQLTQYPRRFTSKEPTQILYKWDAKGNVTYTRPR